MAQAMWHGGAADAADGGRGWTRTVGFLLRRLLVQLSSGFLPSEAGAAAADRAELRLIGHGWSGVTHWYTCGAASQTRQPLGFMHLF